MKLSLITNSGLKKLAVICLLPEPSGLFVFADLHIPSDLPHAFLILTAIGIVSSLLAYLIFQYQRKA